MKRTTIFLEKEDYSSINIINRHIGSTSNSTAIRYALREIARQLRKVDVKDNRDNQSLQD